MVSKIISTALIGFATFAAANEVQRDLAGTAGGFLFTMSDCPGMCLTYNRIQGQIALSNCSTAGNMKVWEVDYSCGEEDGFFQVRNVMESKCIADPTDCSSCNQGVTLVDCDNNNAAWFSYGSLHKTGPNAYYLYNTRCWLKEGKVSALSTPSLDSKTCPEDFSAGACRRLEWNADHFSRDISYYEWGFNEVKTECDDTLFP